MVCCSGFALTDPDRLGKPLSPRVQLIAHQTGPGGRGTRRVLAAFFMVGLPCDSLIDMNTRGIRGHLLSWPLDDHVLTLYALVS
jgi:hypothetical protein